MAKPPVPDRSAEPAPSLEEDFYEVPDELSADGPPDAEGADGEADGREDEVAAPSRGKLSRRLTIGLAAGTLLLGVGGLWVYRTQQRNAQVREAIARAEVLLRDDTAASDREAAHVLEPLAQVDPLQAGSARAFALALLAADYRDTTAEASANALLVEPERAEVLPRHAALAKAALALGRSQLGDATRFVTAARDASAGAEAAPDARWADVLTARISLRAKQLEGAAAPAAAGARAGGVPFPPGLAVHGDVLRRSGDAAAAGDAYRAALAASARQPRAVYGLAKLALSGHGSAEEATRHLLALSQDKATPGPERARAAVYLAALQLRAGARDNASAALESAGLEGEARTWGERAAAALAAHHGSYRAVLGAPLSLESASDDDPPELQPLVPEPPRPAVVAPPAPPPAKAKPKATPAKKAAAVKKAAPATKKPAATKKKHASQPPSHR